MATPYFAGGNEGKTHAVAARKIARRLELSNPNLGYGFLYSAASYVLRDKRSPNDSAVVSEARRRKAHLDLVIERRTRVTAP